MGDGAPDLREWIYRSELRCIKGFVFVKLAKLTFEQLYFKFSRRFQERIFTCNHSRRYSRERASQNLEGLWNLEWEKIQLKFHTPGI